MTHQPGAPHSGERIGFPIIFKYRYARNYIPKFRAKFHVPEEEADGLRLGLAPRYR